MNLIIGLGHILLTMSLSCVQTGEKASQDDIEKLTKNLNDNDPEVRDKAVKNLIDLWENENVLTLVERSRDEAKANNEELHQRCKHIADRIKFRKKFGKKFVNAVGSEIDELHVADGAKAIELMQKWTKDPKKYHLEEEAILGTLSVYVANLLKDKQQKEDFISLAPNTNLMNIKLRGLAGGIVLFLGDSDEFVRHGAVTTLGRMQAKEYIKEISALLKDRNGRVIAGSMYALAEMQAKEYKKEIASFLDKVDISTLGELDAKEGAIQALGRLQAREYTKEISEFLKSNSEHLRAKAISVLRGFEAKEYAKEFGELLGDKSPGVRIEAIRAVCQLNMSEHSKKLIKLLDDQGSYKLTSSSKKFSYSTADGVGTVSEHAALAVGHFKCKDSIDKLVKMLKSKISYERGAAVWAIGRLGLKEYAKNLAELLNDNEPFALRDFKVELFNRPLEKVDTVVRKVLKDWGLDPEKLKEK